MTALGESDCEDLDVGSLVQPINAVTSLAFSIVGLAMIGWARAASGRELVVRWAFVGAMVATGVGSFLYHGPQTTGSGFLHDVTFLTALLVLATANAAAGLGWGDRSVATVFLGSVAVVSLVLIAVPTSTNALTAVAIVGIVASDIALFGQRGRGTPWYLAAVGLLGLALVTNAFGRTGSPLCDPDSVLQLHGAWHLLAASALGCYAVATGAVRARRSSALQSVGSS